MTLNALFNRRRKAEVEAALKKGDASPLHRRPRVMRSPPSITGQDKPAHGHPPTPPQRTIPTMAPDLALVKAINDDDLPGVQDALQRGADPNARDNDGNPAIALAAWKGATSIMGILLFHKADVNARGDEGQTALICAAHGGHDAAVHILLRNVAYLEYWTKEGATALIWAISQGNADVAKRLVNAGANVNAPDNEGNTPLLWASNRGHLEIVKLLTSTNMVNINHQSQKGLTALMIAASNNSPTIAAHLLKKGAQQHLVCKHGLTALWYAVQGNRVAVAEVLLRTGGSATIHPDGYSMVDFAQTHKRVTMLECLRRYGIRE